MLFTTKSPTTVDGVMAAFNKTIADLRGVEATQTAEAEAQAAARAAAEKAEVAAKAEAARAASIASKMEALVA